MFHAEIHAWIGWLDCRKYLICMMSSYSWKVLDGSIVPICFFYCVPFLRFHRQEHWSCPTFRRAGTFSSWRWQTPRVSGALTTSLSPFCPWFILQQVRKSLELLPLWHPGYGIQSRARVLIKVKIMLFSIFSLLFCPCSWHNDISFSFESLFQSEETSKHRLPVRAIILWGTEYLSLYC